MTAPEEKFIQVARKGVSMLAAFAQGLLDDLEQSTTGQASEKVDLLTDCPDHKPIQHRDGKKPWCRRCGCDAQGTLIGKPRDTETLADQAVSEAAAGTNAEAFARFEAAEQKKINCPSGHDRIDRGDQGREGWFCRDCDAAFRPVNAAHGRFP